MRVSYSSTLGIAPSEAYKVLLSSHLAHERMTQLGAGDPHVEEVAEGSQVIARFTVPTHLLPEMARAFVKPGEVLTVRTRPAEDSAPGHLRTLSELLPSSLPLEVRITVAVDPVEAEDTADVLASQLTYIAEYSIAVPLFGKKLERACQGWISDLMRADAERVEALSAS